MPVTIYHNPRCSKSRLTLALLEARGIPATVVEYLKDTPDAPALRALIAKLGVTPRQVMRRGEAVYKELGLEDPTLDEADLIAAMVANPILIERPIVVSGDKAAIGRPPEAVLDIL